MIRSRTGALAATVLSLSVVLPGPQIAVAAARLPIVAAASIGDARTESYVPDHLIIRWRAGTSAAERRSIRADAGLSHLRDLGLRGLELLQLRGKLPEAAAARLATNPHVEYAEPDFILTTTVDPTAETYFGQEWGLDNTGQTVNETAGTAGVDINFLGAAGVTLGDPSVVVAVIDDGVDLGHPDLVDRAWDNPGESGAGRETNGIDDDGNGYVDDVHGWDFVYNDSSVHKLNQDFHGTHVAGTIAASANGLGVVGVAPQVQIMALKFIGPKGGSTSDAIDAISYAAANGADVMNASWGGPDFSQALEDAIAASGLLMVAAAGNEGADLDASTQRSYPASYDLDNIISVGAADQDGQLAPFSNYGTTSVDLVAPGVNILSDYPESRLAYMDGTSMAAPHVTGVAALAISQKPWLASNPSSLRNRLKRTGTDAPATHGFTASGKMVNAYWALDFTRPSVEAPVVRIARSWARRSGEIPIRIAWNGMDVGSGLSRYQLQQRTDEAAWVGTSLSAPLTTAALLRLTPAHTYRFRVRAWDLAGNKSAWATTPAMRLRLRNEGSSTIAISGTWTRPSVDSAIGGRLRASDQSGARARMSFSGRSLGWIAERGPGHGRAEVYIDGLKVATIDLEAVNLQPRRVVFSRSWPTSTARTIEIHVQGTAGRPTVTLDAFTFLR